jgi:hypothetical protein
LISNINVTNIIRAIDILGFLSKNLNKFQLDKIYDLKNIKWIPTLSGDLEYPGNVAKKELMDLVFGVKPIVGIFSNIQ